MTAADEATEIFLMDASLKRIASGLGRLDMQVMPGLYKVRFRSGATQQDQLVEVAPGGAGVEVSGDPVRFHSAAPIAATLTTHEYQAAPAAQTSKEVHRSVGQGGRLFLFVRDEDEGREFDVPGVSIHALDGAELARLAEGQAGRMERWAALSLEMDPGTYSVRVDSGRLGDYELFATVAPDWQTQAYFVMEDLWSDRESVRAPSLRAASLMMARPDQGFEFESATARLTELARQALMQGRQVISSALMQRLASDDLSAPMLTIMGAHLLLQMRESHRDLLGAVVERLHALLGEHPDVQALSLALRDGSRPRVERIERPPTLRASWDRIVQASRKRAGLVPADTPAGRIAAEVVRAGPWLIHRLGHSQGSRPERQASLAEAARVLERMISSEPERLAQVYGSIRSGGGGLTTLERGVLEAVRSYSQARERPTDSTQEPDPQAQARKLLSSLAAPKYSVAEAVVSLAKKIGE
ncbi:hypothetical protein CKO23_07720 [Thiocystis violacea]|nr:hypothetical protein [Thiocystis violacea]